MLKETIVHLASPSRDDFRVEGYRFLPEQGSESKVRVAIVAGLNGRELAQMHAAAQLINFLKTHQAEDADFIQGEILVVPAVNTFGFNMGERNWPLDKTDINAMFPGFAQGETTQRIAHGLFEKVKGFDYGIELVDRRDQYDCMPYVQVINSGFECRETAKYFGLQFAHLPHFKPADAGSLQYNWAVFETKAYGVVFGNRQPIEQATINSVLDGLIRFLSKVGAIKAKVFEGYATNFVTQEAIHLVPVTHAGVFVPRHAAGYFVKKGDLLGKVYSATEGELLEKVYAPIDGLVTCQYHYALIYENTIAFRMISII